MPHFGNGSLSYSGQALCRGRLNSSFLGGTELGSSPTVWYQGRQLSIHIRRWHSYLSDTEDIAEVIHARPTPQSRHPVGAGSLILSFWLSSLSTLYSELFWTVFFFTTLFIGILELVLFREYFPKLNYSFDWLSPLCNDSKDHHWIFQHFLKTSYAEFHCYYSGHHTQVSPSMPFLFYMVLFSPPTSLPMGICCAGPSLCP